MEVIIKSPIKAIVKFDASDDIEKISKTLSYTNKSISFQVSKLMKNRWLKQKDPIGWQAQINKLMPKTKDCLLKHDGKDYWVRPGSVSYLSKYVDNVHNEIHYPDLSPIKWKVKPDFEPFGYQSESVSRLIAAKHGNVSLPTGCHSRDTLILKYDGSLDKVQNIKQDDLLMGPDGQPRRVLQLISGREEMYRITPNIGESFDINKSHILSLKSTGLRKGYQYPSENKKGQIVNISLEEYLNKSKYFKHTHKLYRSGVISFGKEVSTLPIDPYILGLWLGDGDSHDFSITNEDPEVIDYLHCFAKTNNAFIRKNGIRYTLSNFELNKSKGTKGNKYNIFLKEMELYKNKHIPFIYKTASLKDRSSLLAGLLDSDGYNHNSCFEISQKNKTLMDDIVFLARSLSLGVNVKEEYKCATNTFLKTKKLYYRANLRGDFTKIPTKIERKKIPLFCLNRNPLVTGFKVESVGDGEYFGFTVDEDHLYMMGDFTVTHNCGKSHILLLLAQQMGLDAVIVTPSQSIFNELLTEFKIRLGDKAVGGYGDGWKDINNKITIAIGKSLTMLKEGTKAYDFFKNKKVLMVDESHTFAAEQLNDVCHGVLADAPYRMFVSATQTRNDGTEKLLASIIGENVLDMALSDAISQGYLCPLKFTVLATFSPSTKIVRDPTVCKRTHFLYNPNIAALAAKIANGSWETKQQSTLILVEELQQIEMLTKLLKVPFAYVHSADKKKAKEFGLEKVSLQESVKKFNTGEVKVLIGTKAIATGTNLYPTHVCINWMGGSSEIVTKQGAMGRSTRRLEISKFKDFHTPKPYTMIYDFRVKGIELLDNSLVKRCGFYQESGGEIKYY